MHKQVKSDGIKELTKKYILQKEAEMDQYEKEKEERYKQQEKEKRNKQEQEEDEEKVRRQQILEDIERSDRDNQIKWDFGQKVYHIMRDVKNPVLLEQLSEIEQQKLDMIRKRSEEGDMRAFDAQNNQYSLSKTDEFDMTDKYDGEQNRVVYDQVRPSYYGDKQETPTFDSSIKVSTQLSRGNSSFSSSQSGLKKNQSKHCLLKI